MIKLIKSGPKNGSKKVLLDFEVLFWFLLKLFCLLNVEKPFESCSKNKKIERKLFCFAVCVLCVTASMNKKGFSRFRMKRLEGLYSDAKMLNVKIGRLKIRQRSLWKSEFPNVTGNGVLRYYGWCNRFKCLNEKVVKFIAT